MLGIDLTLVAAKGLITEAFLITGDSDLIPAICVAKDEGVVVYLVHGAGCGDDLLDEVDERIPLSLELINSALRMF